MTNVSDQMMDMLLLLHAMELLGMVFCPLFHVDMGFLNDPLLLIMNIGYYVVEWCVRGSNILFCFFCERAASVNTMHKMDNRWQCLPFISVFFFQVTICDDCRWSCVWIWNVVDKYETFSITNVTWSATQKTLKFCLES